MAAARNPLTADLDRVLDRFGGRWQDLKGARLFVTGGSGFFGSWLLETLLWANARLDLGVSTVVLTRDPPAFRARAPHLAGDRAVTLHAGDVRDFAFPDGTFSHVIHAAADPSAIVDARVRRRAFDTIVDGTRRVLECARHAGAARFLYTSSGAVYGRQLPSTSHVREDDPGAPDASDPAQFYGEAKRAAEALCAIHADADMQPSIARCFAFLGPYLTQKASAAENFVRDALAGGPIRILGDGTPRRSYLYAADLALWLWTILLRGKPLRPYNVGSTHEVSIYELAEAIARAAGPGIAIEVARQPVAGRPPDRYVPSTTRAEEELGLRQDVPLDEAIARTLAWHRRRAFA